MRTAAAIAALAAVAITAGCQSGPKTRDDLVVSSQRCEDTRFTIYFEEGSARLTQPARVLIRETSQRLKPCTITSARVVGLADSTGTTQANLTLSQRRAIEVAEALRDMGLPAPQFEIDAAGDQGAALPDGRENPVRRRAEVFLEVE